MTALRILACALCMVLAYVLYLPCVHPAQRFLQQIRMEHERNVTFWGEYEADQILQRALSLCARPDELAPAAIASTPGSAAADAHATAAEPMTAVVQQLFHNRYAQGFEALLLLAAYRFSALSQWVPWVAGFVLIACIDGYVLRIVRSREFLERSPTRFALCAIGATLTLAFTLLLLIIPASIDPLLLGCLPLLFGVFAARAITHFHA